MLMDGCEVDFVVCWECGIINCFIYFIVMLVEVGEEEGFLDIGLWNGCLMYCFQGGVGIGYIQGSMDYNCCVLQLDVFGQGYVIIYFIGICMSEYYNMQVGGEIVLMVKECFVEEYGELFYIVGLGVFGGVIQQYVYVQNYSGLIDVVILVQSYLDMVIQIIYIGDCELFEYYMDVIDQGNEKWQIIINCIWLVGFNVIDVVLDLFYDVK